MLTVRSSWAIVEIVAIIAGSAAEALVVGATGLRGILPPRP